MQATVAPNWQQAIFLRLQERDTLEKQHDAVFHHYRKLTEQTRLLKQRNRALLSAAAAATSTSAANAVAGASSPSSSATPANPVQLAYITSLEQQLSTLRDEVATLYKTQGQNAQRLLLMSESHREKEEEARRQSELLAKLQLDYEKLKRQAEDLIHAAGEKDRGIQILQDELATLSLELSQIETRNEDLKKDNASLLQRWLDRMNEEADKMNEGTIWLEEVRKRRESSSPAEERAGVGGDGAASSPSAAKS
ncbi:Autophagy-related protein 16 [Kalmanozyma brasiliensis GHG001]|uniref:Autophagy-related protein 16 domain-containing protein n=1 Tax=Kalmanozyma brasiliensis (strain GHG001) TaxID=1365824 RepID=V5ECY0_KALBG|nr:Autophagy-related protein 16 [Kalmanozyma brasiliensis GHG001]EST08316.1 Autophagy-related protein 16 [Kalmanozyma brasiliensis GHG001]